MNALFAKQDKENCAFCLGKHNHEDCPTVKDIKQRKSIVVRFARCFKCMKKGHRARECKSKLMCKKCGRGHHISLCEVQVTQQLPSDSQMSSDVNSITTSPSTLHVGTGELRYKQRVQLSGGSASHYRPGCCLTGVVIARLSPRVPLSARSLQSSDRIGLV